MSLLFLAFRGRFLLLAAVAGLLSGCAASRIPPVPPVSSDVKARLGKLTLGLERSRGNAHHAARIAQPLWVDGEIVEALRRRGGFKEAGFVDELASCPDIVVKDPFFGKGQLLFEPMLVFATAGVIPQEYDTFYWAAFVLQGRDGSKLATINKRYADPTMVGWIALPLKLFPQWAGKPADSRIIAERFAYAIEKAACGAGGTEP